MSKKLNIAISGASGGVGRHLVRELKARGAEIVVVGRDPAALAQQFPQCPAVAFADISGKLAGFDLFLHLPASPSTSHANDMLAGTETNATVVETFRACRQAGIGRFIYVPSLAPVDWARQSGFADSERALVERLTGEPGPVFQILHLPGIVDSREISPGVPTGRFSNFFAAPISNLRGALKPMVRIERIAGFVLGDEFGVVDEDGIVTLTDGQEGNLFYTLSKRLFDLVASVLVLAFFFWLFLAIWVVIRLDSPGPALLLQKRVGQYGRPFTCYKFRTMDRATPARATHEIQSSAVTRVGGVLRRTKLDELPQFFNVLRNQMSLVGPRPCLPSQTELVAERQARSVLDLKPGITGLSQVNGIDMSDPRRLALSDAKYRAMRSWVLDASILFGTVWGKGGGDRTRAVD